MTPEQKASVSIDALLTAAGWDVCTVADANIHAATGVAIREFPLNPGFGFADYLLYVNGRACGVIEAKKEGATLTGVELQSSRYAQGLPAALPAWCRPLPFVWESTGVETHFTNGLGPEPRARSVFAFFRPELLVQWLNMATPAPSNHIAPGTLPAQSPAGGYAPTGTFLARMRTMPMLVTEWGSGGASYKLWPAQISAITNLEKSLAANKPKALIQMATGSGKTFTSIGFIYRLIKFGGARRVLFLVDRGNLARQTKKEFDAYASPYNNYKFGEEYIVQHLQGNQLDTSARVVSDRATALVQSFEQFIAQHKDEITALQILYSRPTRAPLKFEDVKALADALHAPPLNIDEGALWQAYATLRKDKVMASISQGQLADFPIVLTGIDEQREIVAELEKQFSRLDEAVANLQRVKANLKRYKASVLKAAVEGRLVETEATLARREGRSYEKGEQLLQRILEERRVKWAGKGKYKEPEAAVTTDLPELPQGWTWASAVQTCEQVVDCHNKTAPYTSTGIPLVRTTNIKDGRLLLEDTRFVDQPTYEFWSRRCPPEPGDVLFTREAPMGEAGIIPPGVKLCLGQRTMLMRPSPAISSSFLLSALLSPVVKDLIDRVAVGSGVKHLRVGDVERLPVPLPPLAEQARIVAEVDRHLSIIREVEAEVDANLQRAQALRQATLAEAFT